MANTTQKLYTWARSLKRECERYTWVDGDGRRHVDEHLADDLAVAKGTLAYLERNRRLGPDALTDHAVREALSCMEPDAMRERAVHIALARWGVA
jgi:hypothetical protein